MSISSACWRFQNLFMNQRLSGFLCRKLHERNGGPSFQWNSQAVISPSHVPAVAVRLDHHEFPLKMHTDLDLTPPTDLCCQSGCEHCVWIKYAEEMVQHYQTSGLEEAQSVIEQQITDVGLREFILLEIKERFTK